jgi:hypothetical protein
MVDDLDMSLDSHQEPSFFLGCASLEDINRFQSHVLETWLVDSVAPISSRAVLETLEVLRQNLERGCQAQTL